MADVLNIAVQTMAAGRGKAETNVGRHRFPLFPPFFFSSRLSLIRTSNHPGVFPFQSIAFWKSLSPFSTHPLSSSLFFGKRKWNLKLAATKIKLELMARQQSQAAPGERSARRPCVSCLHTRLHFFQCKVTRDSRWPRDQQEPASSHVCVCNHICLHRPQLSHCRCDA